MAPRGEPAPAAGAPGFRFIEATETQGGGVLGSSGARVAKAKACHDCVNLIGDRTSNVMGYVGNGRGGYVQETFYRYVGEGTGDFDMLRLPTSDRSASITLCVGVALFAALALLLIGIGERSVSSVRSKGSHPSDPGNVHCDASILTELQREYCCLAIGTHCGDAAAAIVTRKTTSLATTAAPTATLFDCAEGSEGPWSEVERLWCCDHLGRGCLATGERRRRCLAWGAPWALGFRGAASGFAGEGEAWLVKSDSVQVQARYMASAIGHVVLHDVAVSGAFLDHHVLRVGPAGGGAITWDGEATLRTLGAQSLGDLGNASFDGRGEAFGARPELEQHVLHVNLPLGFHMEVFRWREHLNVQIEISKAEGFSGLCGGSGDTGDEEKREAGAVQADVAVRKEELLFETSTPRSAGEVPSLEGCAEATLEEAADACGHLQPRGAALYKGCRLDVCWFGGSHSVDSHGAV